MLLRAASMPARAIVALGLYASLAQAIPRFNEVNSFYHNGTACPPMTKYNAACPALCTSAVINCPLVPTSCPGGQSLCWDGACHADCASVAAPVPCSCPSQPGALLYKCPKSTTVNITHWQPVTNDAQLQATCATAYNHPAGYGTWATYNGSADTLWNVCEAPAGISFPTQTPFFLTYLILYLAYFGFLGIWIAYKTLREKTSDISTWHSEYLDGAQMQLKGYQNDIFGLFMLLYTGIVSLGWLVFLLVISLDYYGYVLDNTPYILTYNSYPLSSKVFAVLWFLSTSWYLVINLFRDKLVNFYRIRQSVTKARYLQVETPRQVIQLLQDEKGRPSPLVQQVQDWERSLRALFGLDMFVETLRVKVNAQDKTRYFEFRSTRYVDQQGSGQFQPAAIDLGTNVPDLLLLSGGLASKDARERLAYIGPNFISVQVPHFVVALWQELTGFFYIYQLQILWVYFYLAYWQIGVSDTGVILLSAIIKVIIRLRSEYRVKSMAEHVNDVHVLRDGEWTSVSTAELVPGDVFRADANQVVPVDAVLLNGDVVVDESSLTGEPLPIRKVPLRDDGHAYDRLASGKIHSLFAGTTIKQASEAASALVMATRTNTEKGQLVKKILFPQPVSFIFHEQLKLVFCILLCWAIFLLGIGSWWLGGTGMTALFYGMTCAAQVMNPLLPAMLVVGQSIASGRLREKGVFCVDLSRILMAGKVQVFCFDKTGTLTKEGLEYYGAYPVSTGNDVSSATFGDVKYTVSDLRPEARHEQLLSWGLASCHSTTQLKTGEWIGNPVDLVMFQSTGASLGVNDDGHDVIHLPGTADGHDDKDEKLQLDLEVVQRFEFQHARASMSVAVRDAQGHVHVFCKGSFEQIKAIANGRSIPANFDALTANLAREGCYVLAIAHRDLGKIDADKVRAWTRDELESQLDLLGLVLFKNLLKDDTKDAILQLKQGDTRTVMITGDNALTGVFIGRQAALVPPNVRVLVGDVAQTAIDKLDLEESDAENDMNDDIDETDLGLGLHDSEKDKLDELDEKTTKLTKKKVTSSSRAPTIVWTDADSGQVYSQDDVDLLLAAASPNADLNEKDAQSHGVELAVTGAAFRALHAQDKMRAYLFATRIFARMTPIDKMVCVELFMERAVTAMCGDGGNDCGALRTAHVGIAMSEAEASVVSPFSTPRRSVRACVDLLIQGRAGLATSFSSFKYLIMYGETMATVKFCTFYYTMSFSQWNFILIDAFITVFCSFAVTQARSASKLSDHRPTARILGPEVMLSVIGQLFINAWFLIGSYIWLYTRDDFFRCHEWDSRATDPSKWWLLGDSYEADVLTFITLFQFINAGFVFNYGYLFRKPWYRNYLLVAVWLLFVIIVSYWELADPNAFGCLMRVNCGDPDVLVSMGYERPTFYIEPYNTPWGNNVLPKTFRYQLWAYAIGNFLAVNLWERVVILGPVRTYLRSKYPLKRLKVTL